MTALISPQDLHARLSGLNTIHLVDATYPPRPDMPVIGNAQAFDIDAVADHGSPLPHTLPSADDFAAAVGEMGIGNDEEVIVYDQSGMAMAAARVWWMFRVFGHKNVKVLNGGLPLWHAMGLPLGHPVPPPAPVTYVAHMNENLFVRRDDVLAALDNPAVLIADARPAERFTGSAADIRPGMPSGHIPGSTSLPYGTLLDPGTGMLRPGDARIDAIVHANPDRIISSCGSGVTAGMIALALFEAGREDVAIYGGSWAEWGQPGANLPFETGSGKKF
jgi:thiosulfate/3-mercaptopyruvate sulfurtransferase